MHLLVLCAFILLPHQASANRYMYRWYRYANLTVKAVIPTSKCADAGTNAKVEVNVGYLDPENRLRYSFALEPIDGQKGITLEQNTWYTITHEVPHEEFVQIEKECICLADFCDQALYDDCFKINLITVSTTSAWYNWKDGWKPGNIEVTMTYKFWFKEDRVETSIFVVGGCGVDWIRGDSSGYLCRDRPASENTYLPWARGREHKTFYGCSWRTMAPAEYQKGTC